MKTRSLAVLAVAMLAGLAVPGAAHAAATGEAAKPPEQIVADAQTAFQLATSVTMQGTIEDGGDRITLDLVAGHGAGGGSMFLNGAKFDIVLAGTDVYFKGGAADWTKLTGRKELGTLLDRRWIKSTTANPDFANMAKLADADQIGPALFHPSGTLTKGAVTRFRGKSAIPLTDHGDEPGTMYVAAAGPAYPLGLVRTTGGAGQVTFSKFNSSKIPKPPTTAIDFDAMKAAGSAT